MKKFYTLALTLVSATAVAFAAEPAIIQYTPSASQGGLIPKAMEVKDLRGTEASGQEIAKMIGIDPNSGIKVDPAKLEALMSTKVTRLNTLADGDEGTWEEVGIGYMNDGILYSFFQPSYGWGFSNRWIVGVDKYSTMNFFNIYNGYYKGAENMNNWYGSTIALYDSQTPSAQQGFFGQTDDWFIDASDASNVKPYSHYTGLQLGGGLGHLYVFSPEDAREFAPDPNKVPQVYGTLKNGVISLPENSLWYWLPEATKASGMEASTFYAMTNPMSIELPNGVGMVSDVNIDVPYCSAPDPENGYVIRVNLSDNVAKAIVYYQVGEYDDQAANLNYVKQVGTQVPTTDQYKGGFSMGYNPKKGGIVVKNYEIVTFYAIAYDADGKEIDHAYTHFYTMPNDDANWKKLEGKATMVDGLVAGVYTTVQPKTLVCDVEADTANPGRYRLVNPYENWTYASSNVHEADYPHYLYVNATVPYQAYIEESLIGLDFGDGEFCTSSPVYQAIKFGQTPNPDRYGAMDASNTITFPANSIAQREKNYKDNAWYTTNKQGNLKITIPRQSQDGVDGIAVDSQNAPAEYFNLQGVRIENPVPGQLIIVRRGDNITKELAK